MSTPTYERIRVANVRYRLEVPIVFGNWIMKHREFALIRIDASDGTSGFAYCLTREGPVAEITNKIVSNIYKGLSASDPQDAFYKTLYSNHSVLAGGVGMRALSVVDIAAWDLHARIAGLSIIKIINPNADTSMRLPATAIVGYPPSISPEETATQVRDLYLAGWRRFKLPCAPTIERTITRLEAARSQAPDSWIGVDMNMTLRRPDEVIDLANRTKHLNIGWIEDFFPPGDAHLVAEARKGSVAPLAVGDEQGGAYHPQALLDHKAVDVIRIDATTNGGVTRFSQILDAARESKTAVSPHMYPHIHARLAIAFGIDVPIEWGIAGTGVHPMDDPLEQPTIEDGRMIPLTDGIGFGNLVNVEWISQQEVDDPMSLLEDLNDANSLKKGL